LENFRGTVQLGLDTNLLIELASGKVTPIPHKTPSNRKGGPHGTKVRLKPLQKSKVKRVHRHKSKGGVKTGARFGPQKNVGQKW